MDAAKETDAMNRTTVKPLTIGEVARLSGVGIETVRFYEREGLLAKPLRTSSGYRKFDAEAVARLQFIRRAKELGFTLNEIKDLLHLRVDAHTTCSDMRTRAEAKIADIEGKIKSLRRMKKALERLMRECSQRGSESECPILDALEGRPGK
jgi:MerR family mercuric resistance operon transcriptional regulator